MRRNKLKFKQVYQPTILRLIKLQPKVQRATAKIVKRKEALLHKASVVQ